MLLLKTTLYIVRVRNIQTMCQAREYIERKLCNITVQLAQCVATILKEFWKFIIEMVIEKITISQIWMSYAQPITLNTK